MDNADQLSSSSGGGPCRLRRSRRLSARRRVSYGNLTVLDDASSSALRTTTADRQPTVTLSQLPPEVLFHVFRQCDVKSLGVVGMCSKFMRDQVLGYLSCPTTVEVLSFEHMEQVDAIRHCRSLGVLMKRVTFLLPIMERLRNMLPFIEKFVGRPKLNLIEPEQDLDAMCRRWHQYGAFVMNAILGWRDSDCEVVHNVLVGLLRTRLFTARVLGTRCGYLLHEEFVLRNFFRCLYLSEAALDQRCAWLSRLLQRWPTVLRARLLFMIYGPCHRGELLWALPAHRHTTAWSPLLRVALAEMGAALASLYGTLDDTIDIIGKLFVMYRTWLPLNRATLLTNCGVDICVTVIASKIREEREDEVAGLLYNLILAQIHGPRSAAFIIDVARKLYDLVGHAGFLQEMPQHGAALLRVALRLYSDGEPVNQAGYARVCHSLLSFIFSVLEIYCMHTTV